MSLFICLSFDFLGYFFIKKVICIPNLYNDVFVKDLAFKNLCRPLTNSLCIIISSLFSIFTHLKL